MSSLLTAGASSVSERYPGRITKPCVLQGAWISVSFTWSMCPPTSAGATRFSGRVRFYEVSCWAGYDA